MAADSEGKSDWRLEWEAKQRKEFQEDPAMWLEQQVRWIGNRLDEQTDWQLNETKSFIENVTELHEKELVNVRESLIFWMGLIAIIALISAGLWIGAAILGILVALRVSFNRSATKQSDRLDRFRDRFRNLLKKTDDREMLSEDREFLRKHADSILFPMAVANTEANSLMSRYGKDAIYFGHGREGVSASDLEHIDMLYREYFHSRNHVGGPSKWKEEHAGSCQLCKAARLVREHSEEALSKFEAEINGWRATLVARIDGATPEGAIDTKEFMAEFSMWYGPIEAGSELMALCVWLRDRGRWTFDQADKVRELCRREKREDCATHVFEKLSGEMERAATECGLKDGWKHYDSLRNGRAEMELRLVRRILGRHNPEAMFLELAELGGFPEYGTMGMLKNYGYDAKLVSKEMNTAKKLMAKESREEAKCYRRELAAAQSFAWLEQAVRKQRYQELNEAIDKDWKRQEEPPRAKRFVGWLRS